MKLVACLIMSCWVSLVLNARVPASSDDPEPDVMRAYSRQLQLPVKLEADQKHNIKELQLFTSADRGRTWQQIGRLDRDGERFQFEAPRDGMYWFILRI